MKLHHPILIIFLLFASTNISAQINLRPGYIITNMNDTILGMIDFRTADRNAHICDFYSAESGLKESYQPGTIYAYRFTDDGKFYVSRKVTLNNVSQTLFLEYLLKGVISLYYFRDDTPHFFFENENGLMIEAAIEEKQVTNEQGQSGIVTKKHYIGIMNYLFQKSDKVMKKIPSLSLSKDELVQITKTYHYDTCESGEQCIEFENKPDRHFLHFDFTAGAGIKMHILDINSISYITNMEVLKSASPSILLGTTITIPRMGSTLGLNAEVETSRIVGRGSLIPTSSSFTNFKLDAFLTDVRLGLQIRPFKGKVRPILEGGGCYSNLWGVDAQVITQWPSSTSIRLDERNVNDDIYHNYLGYYVGAGLRVNWKKGDFILKGLYEHRTAWGNKISTWSGHIGYIF